MQVALFGRSIPAGTRENLAILFSKFSEMGVDVWIYEPLLETIRKSSGLDPRVDGLFTDHHTLPGNIDFLFALGGDGTFLETVTLVRDSGIPVLGVNYGRLGFLSYISKEDLDVSLDSVFSGRYDIEERMLLKVEAEGGTLNDLDVALNEVRIYKNSGTLITVHVKVNEEFLSAYWADGLLVSTPTGSTAYNLSVGGPIVVPESHSIVISPIAPHNLTVRPLVLPDSSVMQLKVDTRDHQFQLALDSRTVDLDVDTVVTVRKADYTLKMIRIENISFYSTLRNKLMWGADKRN